ncbi:MAG: hypothetical protein KME54_25325 [Tolypothrix brevis GSE-NOS-MK-07-07A]|nr:hypothetical protein [Tolypothrix brevis GSE-NOS-MK-07-07A]
MKLLLIIKLCDRQILQKALYRAKPRLIYDRLSKMARIFGIAVAIAN